MEHDIFYRAARGKKKHTRFAWIWAETYNNQEKYFAEQRATFDFFLFFHNLGFGHFRFEKRKWREKKNLASRADMGKLDLTRGSSSAKNRK